MAETNDSQIKKLMSFLAGQTTTSIQHVTPSSPDYAEIRSAFVIDPSINPPVIIRPQNTDEVALVTGFMVEHGIEFTIRVGGHDIFSRAFKSGAVTVDLRRLDQVQVDRQQLTARIGGGTLTSDLAHALGEHGLIAPMPNVPSVGYAGWAMYGGYGPYSSQFGLGVDQILRAKVVDHKGQVVEADAELLKAIRGAGGAFGIIVDLTIPVFPLQKIFAGLLMFDPKDMAGALQKFNEGYRRLSEEIPDSLSIQQAVINTPDGPAFCGLFVWAAADVAEGEKWLAKITSLAPIAVNAVQWTTPAAWLEWVGNTMPQEVSGRIWTVSLREITDEVVDVFTAYCPKMTPGPGVLMSLHQCRGPSASPKENSVFSPRTPHYLVEILTVAPAAEKADDALAWGRDFRDALAKTDAGNILPETYLSMTAPDELDMTKIYGANYQFLKGLKNARDPSNVYKTALAWF